MTITSLAYDQAGDLMTLACDFSELAVAGAPDSIVLSPSAIGNRIAADGYPDADVALTAIVLEHVARVAPAAAGVTVDWQSPSDQEKSAQLDTLADRIGAARVLYASAG